MMDNDFEFTPAPETEFSMPKPETEFTPPLPEFPPIPAPAVEMPKKRRKKRFLYYVGALLLYGWILLGNGKAEPVPPPAQTLPTVPVIEAAPTSAPPATVETEPAPAVPSCDVIYFGFSSQMNGKLLLHDTQTLLDVRAELWDTATDNLEIAWEVPEEAIEAGEFIIPAYDEAEIYRSHQAHYDETNTFPSPELRVFLRYQGAEGEETLTLTQRPQYEQGWSLRYFPENTPATEYTYPGCFALVTYDSMEQVSVVFDDPAQLASDAIRVSGEAGGYRFTAEDCQVEVLEREGYRTDDSTPIKSYRTVLLLPRPADLPENSGGIAYFTVTQPLKHYDIIWETQLEIPY